MKEVTLTRGKVAVVDDDAFALVSPHKWQAVCPKGTVWYASAAIKDSSGKRKTVYMHRLITGAAADDIIDHRDRDGLNNTQSNLRFCTRSENARNRPKQRGRTHSRFKGVSRVSPWIAYIVVDNKQRKIGNFETEEEAAKAYDKEAQRLHGDYASLNFPVVEAA